MNTEKPTHEVIDLVYHEDEYNIVFEGTLQECDDWVHEQSGSSFTYKIQPIIKK